jgi:hypothetical protein
VKKSGEKNRMENKKAMIDKIFFCMFLFFFSFNRLIQAEVNIIPTPKFLQKQKGSFHLIKGDRKAVIVIGDNATKKEKLAAEELNKILQKDYLLPPFSVKTFSNIDAEAKNANLILIGTPATNPLIKDYVQQLQKDLEFLEEQKSGQSYIVKFFSSKDADESAIAVLSGKEEQGTLYAAVTFSQLVKKQGKDYLAPFVHIQDYPDFEYRWASMTPWPGIVGLSGTEYVDYALRWKINVLQGDSYSRLRSSEKRLLLNRYAKARGVYFANLELMDLGLKNRITYPDGDLYQCIGCDNHYINAGFCPSNEELQDIKNKRLKKYVEETEPGMLYLHFLDNDFYYLAERGWKNRCAECRKKWPNDIVEAVDGMAGATAHVYNTILETIFSVKKENGYDAKKECIVIFVGAPYANWKETDSDWEKEVNYYVSLSRTLRQAKNVFFMLREIGPRVDGTKMRALELAKALKERGAGHGLAIYHYMGSQRRLVRNNPVRHRISAYWLSAPIITNSYEGADLIFFAGTSHPTLLAEYSWNRKPAGGYWSEYKTRQEWIDEFGPLILTSASPEKIFGKGKFFDRAYRNIYGEKAGGSIADGVRPVDNLFAEHGANWLQFVDKAWSFSDSLDLQRRWLVLFNKIADANRRAIQGIGLALKSDDLLPGKRDELKTVLAEYEKGLYWANLAIKEAGMYIAWQKEGEEVAKPLLDEVYAFLEKAPEKDAEFKKVRRERIQTASVNLTQVKDESNLFIERLASLARQAPGIREKIKNELRVREGYNLAERTSVLFATGALAYRRIGVTGKFTYIMNDKNLGMVERFKGFTEEEVSKYDIILYSGSKHLSPDELNVIRNYLSAGGGLFIDSVTAYHIVGNSVNLESIADWLGAKAYGNYSGKLVPAFLSFFSQDLEEWLGEFQSGKGRACLMVPLTGVPILTYEGRKELIFLLANKYGSGRVISSSYAKLPQDLFYKILLWLGQNKIDQ